MEAKNMIFEAKQKYEDVIDFYDNHCTMQSWKKGYFGKKMLKKICHFKINNLPLSNFFFWLK